MNHRYPRLIVTIVWPVLLIAISGCKDSKPASNSGGLSAPAASPEVQRSVALPPHATEVAHGTDKVLNYKADEDGAVYLTDESLKRIVMRKNMRAGQVVEFSPNAGQAKIDGQVVFQVHPSKHEYKLYYEKITQ